MAKKQISDKQKSEFKFVSTKDFSSIEGTYEKFFRLEQNDSIAIILNTEDGKKAVGLSTVTRSLFKGVLEQGGLKVGDDIVLEKKTKRTGKKYFDWDVYINGNLITPKFEYDENEILNYL